MKRKTLLLIDSSQVLMDLTKKILERAGYHVRCAVGISEARECLIDREPDGIVLECGQPDESGLDFCRELKDESPVPIMMISSDMDDEVAALQAGASDFIKKPYDSQVLTARIGIMLSAAPEPDFEHLTVSISKKAKRLFVAAACLIFVLIGAGALYMLHGNAPYEKIPGGQALSVSGSLLRMDGDAKAYSFKEQCIEFPGTDDVRMSAESTDVKMLLLNPKNNSCYFSFEIILKNTGSPLYSSGLVKPGMCIDEIALPSGLPKGRYGAIMKIHAYSLKDLTEINGVDEEFYLTVS